MAMVDLGIMFDGSLKKQEKFGSTMLKKLATFLSLGVATTANAHAGGYSPDKDQAVTRIYSFLFCGFHTSEQHLVNGLKP